MAQWQFAFKPTFLHELNAFEAKVTQQILKKLDLLAEDPRPDAKTKKQLKNLGGKLHRLRAGDFRIFYTFAEPFVSLLSVKKRDESTYESDVEPEMLGGEIPNVGNADGPSRASNVNAWLGPSRPKSSPLPRSIDQSLLVSLGIPEAFHAALVKVATEDDLLDCPVPQDIVDRVIDAVTGKPIAEVARQPDLLLAQPEDLLRYREGELLGFLLRLEPEQEKLAQWALSSKGATLLKGGPGTGKSTVALYRVREILAAWKKQKRTAPKLLFTTYTRALTRISEQLLRSLVGPEGMVHVEVKTADAVLRPMAIAGGSSDHLVSDLRGTLARAIENAAFVGTSLKVASQKESVAKLSRDFLLEEILGVIEGRGLSTLDEYLAAVRPGRRVSLAKVQREAVWRVREAFVARLAEERGTTVEGWRRRAAERIKASEVPPMYDAVVIDEAQDLSPTTLAALVGLAKDPAGVFLTADANQSIYGASFRWSDIHAWLKFQGRTAVLRANHRSTREIGEAADAYLRGGAERPALDEDDGDDGGKPVPTPTRYVHSGPIPAVRAVEGDADEGKLLARYFREATRALKLGLGGCAVLTPTNEEAQRIAHGLSSAGLSARKVDASNLDLREAGVKVMTLKNAKGLEFPIVALAGFSDRRYPPVSPQATDAEREEIVARERRTMFVAMTRAMRALLVIVPAEGGSTLLDGFVPPAWNDGREDQTKGPESVQVKS